MEESAFLLNDYDFVQLLLPRRTYRFAATVIQLMCPFTSIFDFGLIHSRMLWIKKKY